MANKHYPEQVDKRNYLIKDYDGSYMSLKSVQKGIWMNDDETDRWTLLSEEKETYHGDFKQADIWKQWYFYQGAQYYNDFGIHEHYGYKPFREANPDLHDITGGYKDSFDEYHKIDDSKYRKAQKKQLKLFKEYQDKWGKSKPDSKEREKYRKLEKEAYKKFEMMCHEYNMKTRGWISCNTYFHRFYCITVDKYDGSIAWDRPFSINGDTMKMLLDKAPFLHQWSQFGLLAGKDGDKLNWVTKDMLPRKAYKK